MKSKIVLSAVISSIACPKQHPKLQPVHIVKITAKTRQAKVDGIPMTATLIVYSNTKMIPQTKPVIPPKTNPTDLLS